MAYHREFRMQVSDCLNWMYGMVDQGARARYLHALTTPIAAMMIAEHIDIALNAVNCVAYRECEQIHSIRDHYNELAAIFEYYKWSGLAYGDDKISVDLVCECDEDRALALFTILVHLDNYGVPIADSIADIALQAIMIANRSE